MGWLFMRAMDGYASPRSYLDNQFTYARDDHRLTVLASSMVGSTYYAACERIEANGDAEVSRSSASRRPAPARRTDAPSGTRI